MKKNELNIREDVMRAFILSQSLEPLSDKPGCTTRYVDSSPGTKIEYFTIAAVNSVWPILEMVERILKTGGQPDCIFDCAYQAQLHSPRNRNGGKVNYAQILLLTPIIAAQTLLYVEGDRDIVAERILDKTYDVLSKTTQKDIEFLQKFVDLSIHLSQVHHQRQDTKREYLHPNFIENSKNVLDAANNVPGFKELTMAGEIRNKYPNCKKIFDDLSIGMDEGIIKRSEKVYLDMLPLLERADVTADCIVVGFYLVITQFRANILFP